MSGSHVRPASTAGDIISRNVAGAAKIETQFNCPRNSSMNKNGA